MPAMQIQANLFIALLFCFSSANATCYADTGDDSGMVPIAAGIDGKGLRIPKERPLFQIHADGSGLKQLSREPGRLYGSPDWSPDGEWIACDTWKLGQSYPDSTVAVMRADGSEMRVLGSGAMPSWSPDGSQLVYHACRSPQSIIIMNRDGTGHETIADHWGSPRWLQTGNRIAIIARDRRGIALFDLAKGKETDIFRGPYSVVQGISVSPDGLRYCFGDANDGFYMATLDANTIQAAVRPLAKSGTIYHSSWSPDGKHVVFQWKRSDTAPFQLYLIDVEGDAKPRLLPGQDVNRHNCDPDWSPDGKSIVFNSQPLN